VVDSGEVGRPAVCSRYNRPLDTAFGYARIDWGKFSVLSFNLYKEVPFEQDSIE
jgi:hypothetical protein